jgi:7-cyano-7-deazaguanine reductase
MHKLGSTVNFVSSEIKNKIHADLENLLKTSVNVSIFDAADDHYKYSYPAFEEFQNIEDQVDYTSMQFDAYNEDPAILKINEIKETKPFSYFSTALRSNCRVTNQPDWGDVFIYMDSNLYPTKESLLQYIVSMRKENHFHEEICECIYKRLWDIFDPRELLVACMYTRRGGIDINPVRASNYELLIGKAKNLLNKDVIVQKTMRQ